MNKSSLMISLLVATLSNFALVGCDSSSDGSTGAGTLNLGTSGTGSLVGTTSGTSSTSVTSGSTSGSSSTSGSTSSSSSSTSSTSSTNKETGVPGAAVCTSSDTSHQCIGLKLVAYTQNSVATITEANAITLVTGMNTVWSQCNIGFQLEDYETVDPTTKGLAYSPDWENDGDTIRKAFDNSTEFLVVAVGPWSDATIAVTEMPGAGVYGTLVDSQYATNPLTVGHELGHYMGLYHVSDTTNLMNPYIGANTRTLTASQCATAKSTNTQYWKAMMRY